LLNAIPAAGPALLGVALFPNRPRALCSEWPTRAACESTPAANADCFNPRVNGAVVGAGTDRCGTATFRAAATAWSRRSQCPTTGAIIGNEAVNWTRPLRSGGGEPRGAISPQWLLRLNLGRGMAPMMDHVPRLRGVPSMNSNANDGRYYEAGGARWPGLHDMLSGAAK
jgi:hypothetical protein